MWSLGIDQDDDHTEQSRERSEVLCDVLQLRVHLNQVVFVPACQFQVADSIMSDFIGLFEVHALVNLLRGT